MLIFVVSATVPPLWQGNQTNHLTLNRLQLHSISDQFYVSVLHEFKPGMDWLLFSWVCSTYQGCHLPSKEYEYAKVEMMKHLKELHKFSFFKMKRLHQSGRFSSKSPQFLPLFSVLPKSMSKQPVHQTHQRAIFPQEPVWLQLINQQEMPLSIDRRVHSLFTFYSNKSMITVLKRGA